MDNGTLLSGLNAIVGRTRDTLSLAISTWYGKVGLCVIFLATVLVIALLNPIRRSDSPKRESSTSIAYNDDQQISIPKVPGGAKSMRPLAEDMALVYSAGASDDQVGLASRWTTINLNDPGQLLVDLSSIHSWRQVERSATFQYIPKPYMMDENRNKPILYLAREQLREVMRVASGLAGS